jgi:hypothetical protein
MHLPLAPTANLLSRFGFSAQLARGHFTTFEHQITTLGGLSDQ